MVDCKADHLRRWIQKELEKEKVVDLLSDPNPRVQQATADILGQLAGYGMRTHAAMMCAC
jgi:hypothetical protein